MTEPPQFFFLNGEEGIDYNKLFTLSTDHYNLRGHSKKLKKTREHLNVRRNFFSKRVIDKWNGLSDYEVNATSTSTFKIRYDMCSAEHDLTVPLMGGGLSAQPSLSLFAHLTPIRILI